MKFQSLKMPPAKISGSQAKAVAPFLKSATPPLHSPPSQPCSQTAGQITPGEERRRSYRVLLRVRASIHVALQGKPVTFDTVTLSVSNHGALVVLKQSLPCETRLVLEHSGTKERVACKVARIAREMPEGFHIPLEFDSPAPNFWRIAFPPSDWRPHDDL